jgi:hypothetical protein
MKPSKLLKILGMTALTSLAVATPYSGTQKDDRDKITLALVAGAYVASRFKSEGTEYDSNYQGEIK